MAFTQIAGIAPNYRDYKNWWLKAYEPGTTTPKSMSDNDTGLPTAAKYELNKDGFIISSGGTLIIPHIDGDYDLWLFPTEAEADANDTTNAERLADDLENYLTNTSLGDSLGGFVSYEFDTVANAKVGLTIGGKVVTLKENDVIRIKSRDDALFDVVTGVAGANGFNIIPHATLNISFALRVGETVSVIAFGAIGDGVTNDQPAIQAALDYGAAVVEFGDENQIYLIDNEITIQPAITIDLQSCIIRANYDTGNVLKCFRDETGRPVFKVQGNRAAIQGGVQPNPNLVGLWIETCNFSEFKGMKFQNLDGYPIILGATGARDIINITIADIETSTGEGIQLLSGEHNGVDYEQITTGRIKDCFFTTNNPGSIAFEVKANDFSSNYVTPNSPSSIFGLTIERCSMNPVESTGGTFISMIATGSSLIYQMQFKNCEGELKYGGLDPVYPCVYLEKVVRSDIDFSGQFNEGDGFHLVNCQHVTLRNTIDPVFNTAFNGRFLVVDSASFGNNFENLSFTDTLMSADGSFPDVPLAPYYFDARYQDSGYGNTSSGYISTNVQRVFDISKFNLIDSSGTPVNTSVSNNPNATFLINGSGNLEVTMADEIGMRWLVPDDVVGKDVIVRCKYRIISSLVGVENWRLAASVGGSLKSPKMDITDQFTDMMYHTKIDTNRFDIFSTSAQAGVVFEIELLEVYLGSFPYPANLNPNDIYPDEFLLAPRCTTATRPDTTKSSIDNGFSILDETLGKPIWWNGTNWIDATGTIA
jgi:hypothetical protein